MKHKLIPPHTFHPRHISHETDFRVWKCTWLTADCAMTPETDHTYDTTCTLIRHHLHSPHETEAPLDIRSAIHTSFSACAISENVSEVPKITGLFCRISSLLMGSFAKETYDLKEPTNRSLPTAAPVTHSPWDIRSFHMRQLVDDTHSSVHFSVKCVELATQLWLCT